MDANREWYKRVRFDFISWLDSLNENLLSLDKGYYDTPGKKGINRINNNLLYHPNKPVYKDHFGAGLDKAPGSADFYIELGLNGCFLAGGFWRPDAKKLSNIREGIDFNGEELKKIIDKPSFKKMFGTLYKDNEYARPPKGYSKEHPHADLLRKKTFAVVRPIDINLINERDFTEIIFATYLEMLPFRRYLNQAALL